MSEYSEQSYWDGRYQLDTEPFEWYQPFSTLRPYIAPLVLNPIPRATTPATHQRPLHRSRRSSVTDEPQQPQLDNNNQPPSASATDPPLLRVLVLGCGCSDTGFELWRMTDGRAEVHSVDYSIQCIEEMRRRYPQSNLYFHVQDVRGMTFPSDYFDLVVDKATLDCLHCLDTTDGPAQLKLAVQCLHRVMRLGATLLSVSNAPPEQRSSHFMLDRLEVMKGQIELEKKEKAMRRVAAADPSTLLAPSLSPPGSKHATPAVINRRVSMTGSLRGSRRSSIVNIDAMPVPMLTQPVVHRLPKPPIPDSTDDSQPRTVTRTSSMASTSASASTSSIHASPQLQPIRRSSQLLDVPPLSVNSTSALEAGTVAVVDDELSAVYDSSDHYLYIVHKELVAATPQTHGLHTVSDAAGGGRRSSLIGLPGHGRRMSAVSLVA